jgi:hypothetical protein
VLLRVIGGVCVAHSYWWSLCCSCIMAGVFIQLLVESVLHTAIGGVRVAHSYWWSPCCSQFLVESVLLTVIGGVYCEQHGLHQKL